MRAEETVRKSTVDEILRESREKQETFLQSRLRGNKLEKQRKQGGKVEETSWKSRGNKLEKQRKQVGKVEETAWDEEITVQAGGGNL